jgi:hypothetical protein
MQYDWPYDAIARAKQGPASIEQRHSVTVGCLPSYLSSVVPAMARQMALTNNISRCLCVGVCVGVCVCVCVYVRASMRACVCVLVDVGIAFPGLTSFFVEQSLGCTVDFVAWIIGGCTPVGGMYLVRSLMGE